MSAAQKMTAAQKGTVLDEERHSLDAAVECRDGAK